MGVRIIYERPDGGVSIVCPAKPYDVLTGTGTWLSIQEIADKDVPAGAAYQIVDETVIPRDRTFRNAWIKGGDSIEVDMPKAREIQRDRIRVMRKPILEALDVDYIRALEDGDLNKQAQIVSVKQELRDATDSPEIESAKTPEALKDVIPDVIRNFVAEA